MIRFKRAASGETSPSRQAQADTRTWLVWITGALTLLSLAAYLKAWLLHMTGYESGKDAST